ncbi:wax ester/triacylglycerol synthase family O-acyltransferase [Nocardia veterana]|uniref:Diacylglycerol O-acyltransferase n=1 Tax=Nocardia veterana TaxID=132249 RepID=A0A7X6M1F1_9NOCA|nr:wax ester/triacylglycerol synthase family O-acyltransferase [Nocardia veterana]NKY88524.1 wax ester/triacylglycerol synthase family O-acyltransferase [Nocardia veterana]
MSDFGPLDTGFMELEDSDRHLSIAIAAVAVVAGPVPGRAQFDQTVTRALSRYGRLRQRMRRTPLDLTAPSWEDDPDFRLSRHVRWAALPRPRDESALRELVGEELARRFDREHPLWQVVVVDNLAGDRWAVIVKAHHSMVDGIAGITVFESLCDEAPESVSEPPERPADSAVDLTATVSAALRFPYTASRFAIRTARTLVPVLRATVVPTPTSSLNGPLGRRRRYAVARTSLAQLHEIGAAFDATVNDVAVAALAGAYRRLLCGRGEEPAADSVRIVIPVSMRPTQAKYAMDNRVSVVIAALPVDVGDPVHRLRAVHERIARHRARGEAEAEASLLTLAGRLPAGVAAWAFRLATRFPQRGISALATNVPGPRHPLRIAGGEVEQVWPAMPVAMRLRTTVAMLSYAGRFTFGITGDYDTTPDIDLIPAAVTEEIETLLARARVAG